MSPLKLMHGPQTGQIAMSKAPIFVVGAPRSGTTLVARIIGRSRDVFAPGETHYFEDVWSRQREIGRLENDLELSRAADRLLTSFGRFNFPEAQRLVNNVVTKQALVERARSLGGGYRGLYLAFMSMLAESVGKTRFCDDTPKHLYYLHTIFSLFPDARVIGCARDPRGFLCSYKNYWMATSPNESVRIKTLYHPIVTSLLWRSSSNLLLKHSRQCCNDRMILVRYETLVEHPEQQTTRICDFLGIDYSDELTQVESHNSSFENPQPGIFTVSVGRWRTCLSSDEVWWTQTLAGDNMHTFGYKSEPVNPPKRALLLASATAPLALVRAIRANTQKRGPLVGYMWRRLLALVQR